MVLAFFILRAWLFVVHLPRSLVPHCERLYSAWVLCSWHLSSTFFGGMKKKPFGVHSFFGLMLSSKSEFQKKNLVEICCCSPRDICYMDPIFPYIYSLIQILGGGADDDDDDDDRMLMERITKSFPTRGVSHCGLAIYIKKYLKAKEELWKTQIFHHAKIYQSLKNPLKETKILQGIITLITNLKFQHKPKYHLSKIFI